jgi:hypothetical protein
MFSGGTIRCQYLLLKLSIGTYILNMYLKKYKHIETLSYSLMYTSKYFVHGISVTSTLLLPLSGRHQIVDYSAT